VLFRSVAREDIEESGVLRGVPEKLADYFDYESYGRDLEINGYYYETGNDIVEVW
jgi:antirestriction protein